MSKRVLLLNRIITLFAQPPVQLFVSLGLLLTFVLSASVNVPLALNGEVPYDFPNYYFSGKRFIEGRPIYDFLESEIFQSLGWHNRVYPADPPLTVIILSPLSYLNYQNAWLFWAGISVMLLTFSMLLTAAELGLSKLEAFLTVAVALSSKPFRFLLFTGHFETLLLFLSVMGWLFLRRKRAMLGLSSWAFAASLKLFPLLWIPVVQNSVGWKRVALGLFLFGVIFFLAGALVGEGNFLTFVYDVVPRSERWTGVVANYSLLSVGTAFGGVFVGTGILLLFAVKLAFDLFKFQNLDSAWACATISSLLLSPLCWWGYLVLTYPIMLFLLMSYSRAERRDSQLMLIGLIGFLWIWPEKVSTPWMEFTILLSYLPTLGLLALYYLASKASPLKA